MKKTQQRSMVEKRGVGPSGFELEMGELEVAIKRKTEMEAARARGIGISAQGEGT